MRNKILIVIGVLVILPLLGALVSDKNPKPEVARENVLVNTQQINQNSSTVSAVTVPATTTATLTLVPTNTPTPTPTPTLVPTNTPTPTLKLLPTATPIPATTSTSNNGYYTNSDGNKVQSPTFSGSVPAGATAKCRDGSYSFSQHRSGTCSGHGGVAQWL